MIMIENDIPSPVVRLVMVPAEYIVSRIKQIVLIRILHKHSTGNILTLKFSALFNTLYL